MADVLTQIQERQSRARDQEIAGAQRDVDWNATFGRMAPDNVLRGTRNMTALIANAVEKKMALAAQTNAEAQRIYINDQKWKAEQRMQPLKDERLKAQIKVEERREAAAAARETLDLSRQERAAREEEHSALAELEMDEIETSPVPDAEKRARFNTIRGRLSAMNKAAITRYDVMRERLNPTKPLPLTPEEKIGNAVRQATETTRARKTVEQEFEKAATVKPETYAQVAAEKKQAEELRGGTLTPEQEKQFARREQAIITAGRQQPAATAAPAAATPAKAAQTPEEWLSLNPNDPRAPAIRAKLGIK